MKRLLPPLTGPLISALYKHLCTFALHDIIHKKTRMSAFLLVINLQIHTLAPSGSLCVYNHAWLLVQQPSCWIFKSPDVHVISNALISSTNSSSSGLLLLNLLWFWEKFKTIFSYFWTWPCEPAWFPELLEEFCSGINFLYTGQIWQILLFHIFPESIHLFRMWGGAKLY